MSEFDNLSDSDWLDIASGHDSEDNESISSRGTSSRPHSRRSSISSRDGDIEAWEGYAYDSSDETAPVAAGRYPSPLARAGSADSQRIPLDLIPNIETELDRAEDERVKEALDQSLVGTLNASRSSTAGGLNASLQNSVPNLRLSFPDPLTSSRDELNRSYEDVSPMETTVAHPEGQGQSVSGEVAQPSDSSLSPTALAVGPEIASIPDSPARVDLEIHLYGSSTEYKWHFVQDLLQKFADVSGQFLAKPLDPNDGPVQTAWLEVDDEDSKPLFTVVKIYDRTEDNTIPEAFVPTDSPSLGIVFLPSIRLPVVSMHSLYLPVLARNDIIDVTYDSVAAMRIAAEDDWDLLTIPPYKVFPIEEVTKSYVATHEGIRNVDSLEIRNAMDALLVGTNRKVAAKPEQSASINAVTIFALVSLIVGFACNTSFHASQATTKTVSLTTPNSTWFSISTGPNRSSGHEARHSSSKAHITSAEDMALSIYYPGTTSLSLTPQIKSLSPILAQTPASLSCTKCAGTSLSNKPPPNEVMTVAPHSSVSAEASPMSPSPVPSDEPLPINPPTTAGLEEDAEKDHLHEVTTKALGLKFVDSLSEVLGVTTKALVKAVNDDTAELFDSLDDLIASIRTQTDEIIKQSKGKARALGDQVQSMGETLHARNDRARIRAKELKKRGEEFISAASEHVRERTNIARKKAHRIRRSVEESDAWQIYRTTRGDWGTRVQEKNGESYRGHGCLKTRQPRHGPSGHLRTTSLSCD